MSRLLDPSAMCWIGVLSACVGASLFMASLVTHDTLGCSEGPRCGILACSGLAGVLAYFTGLAWAIAGAGILLVQAMRLALLSIGA